MSLTVAGCGFRTIGRLVHQTTTHFDQPPQTTTSINHLDQPPRPTDSTSLTVAGFTASGQSADWSINHRYRQSTTSTTSTNHLDQPPRSSISATSSLTVASYGFRTIGRLVHQTTTHFDQPPQTTTSINHLDQPPRSTTSTNRFHQSDRGGLHSFRTIGRLVHQPPIPPINHFNHLDQPPRSTTSIIHFSNFQSDRGELRLQDNRQTGPSTTDTANQPLQPPRPTTSINHLDHPFQQLPV
ncbi:uncharacterized protein N7500_007303 [Penicillium coprophilum]|uniref:uncharacterized protein n=1 Tax=Penicillium coprophilum TaxID=36646 RepID=UPI002391E72E|nr:uncharacterized protein N7500_007303 [Penicillium coprophilum]KAJ5165473.1 hypothetical protein N7500_007303 [Penicillium coprophilum]